MADQKSYYADKTDFKNDLTGAGGMAPYDGPVIYKGVIYTVSSDPGTGFFIGRDCSGNDRSMDAYFDSVDDMLDSYRLHDGAILGDVINKVEIV